MRYHGAGPGRRPARARWRRRWPGHRERAIARAALERNGLIVAGAGSMRDAIEVANRRAPEHLEIVADGAERIAQHVRHAGAIFLGDDTPEPVGDYIAGPSHVLPTGGTARYASPLGVYDFVKRTSVIRYTRERLAAGRATPSSRWPRRRDCTGHAEAVRIRDAGGQRLGFRRMAHFPPHRLHPDFPASPAAAAAPPQAGARPHGRLHGRGGRGRLGQRLAGAAGRRRTHADRRRRARPLAAHRLDRAAARRTTARPMGICAGRSWRPW